MKKIRTIAILFLLILFTYCTSDNGYIKSIENKNIAKIENNEVVLTADRMDLLDRLERMALEDNINVQYTHLEVRKMDNGNYALFAFSDDYLVKSAVSLMLDETNLRLYSGGGTITCSTTGCSSNAGCTPVQKTTFIDAHQTTYWTCSTCSSTCTKTTSVQL